MILLKNLQNKKGKQIMVTVMSYIEKTVIKNASS